MVTPGAAGDSTRRLHEALGPVEEASKSSGVSKDERESIVFFSQLLSEFQDGDRQTPGLVAAVHLDAPVKLSFEWSPINVEVCKLYLICIILVQQRGTLSSRFVAEVQLEIQSTITQGDWKDHRTPPSALRLVKQTLHGQRDPICCMPAVSVHTLGHRLRIALTSSNIEVGVAMSSLAQGRVTRQVTTATRLGAGLVARISLVLASGHRRIGLALMQSDAHTFVRGRKRHRCCTISTSASVRITMSAREV
ncbi:hypothetical protein DOTSEDRAFT_35234 [Dothistroma septosporum NZE10]|uniref:Uncharacterized protein n=1 Tax=Dothistroma septosporum (strain NZE10 / CBS 128990) TaxID=675120 RepID=M2YLH4_DOTSN|nr:hypothetical protein DOTSEDRAFT_35234 [Dothistroma septosporum NZE10]